MFYYKEMLIMERNLILCVSEKWFHLDTSSAFMNIPISVYRCNARNRGQIYLYEILLIAQMKRVSGLPN